MNTLSLFIIKNSNWKSLLLFLALFFSFNLYFLPKGFKTELTPEEQKLPIIDLMMKYDPIAVKDAVAQYSGAAKKAYILGATITDGIYPIVYFIFMAIILSLVFYKWRIHLKNPNIVLLPLSIVVFDYLENAMIVKMLRTYPDNIDSLAEYCSFFTVAKWTLTGVVFGVIIIGIILNLLKRSHS